MLGNFDIVSYYIGLDPLTNSLCCVSDPVGSIISKMNHPRSRPKVIEKILELGLVRDKKELHKKRMRKDGSYGPHKQRRNYDEEDDGIVDSESEGERPYGGHREPLEEEGRCCININKILSNA